METFLILLFPFTFVTPFHSKNSICLTFKIIPKSDHFPSPHSYCRVSGKHVCRCDCLKTSCPLLLFCHTITCSASLITDAIRSCNFFPQNISRAPTLFKVEGKDFARLKKAYIILSCIFFAYFFVFSCLVIYSILSTLDSLLCLSL